MENHGRSTPFAWPELYKEGTFKLGSFGVMVTEPFKITWRYSEKYVWLRSFFYFQFQCY